MMVRGLVLQMVVASNPRLPPEAWRTALLQKGTSEHHLTATLHLEKKSKDALDAETRAAAAAAQEKLERRRPLSALRRKKLPPEHAGPAKPSEQSDARPAEPASTSTPPPGALAPTPPPPRKSRNAHRTFQFRPLPERAGVARGADDPRHLVRAPPRLDPAGGEQPRAARARA